MSISKLKDVESFFENCTSEAKTLLHLKINCLQGPHGVPASKTHMLRTMLESLSEQISGIESKYLEKVDINSALTLVNEQLHSMLRLKTETPSVLDCARDFLRGVVEERYGKGVRQRSVRADTTKFNAGTLPLNMYQNNIPPKYASIDLSVTDIRINETAEDPSLTEPRTIDQLQSSNEPAGPVLDSIYDENDLVAVMLDDQLSLGSLTERVFETDKVCKAILYKENDGLEFHKDMQRDIPLNLY
ncbi:unnamed protein product [Mytilus coruscus]|uniref:Uncharacterized protein n=1 Tax=Mytilus coruscus TaxID=42192 RepID=A0A6J8CU81_MYTCO|nr:unnamed protein product [Mytilus coruscus]